MNTSGLEFGVANNRAPCLEVLTIKISFRVEGLGFRVVAVSKFLPSSLDFWGPS